MVDRITGAGLIMIHNIGILPADQDAAEAFYRVVDAAYDRRSAAVTAILHPASVDPIMPKTVATAAEDRLLHHAHRVLTEGTSDCVAESTAGTGLLPFA